MGRNFDLFEGGKVLQRDQGRETGLINGLRSLV